MADEVTLTSSAVITMIMRSFILFILDFLLAAIPVFAQKEKVHTVKNVRGEYAMIVAYSDITGREATEKAREDAKRKAIEQICGSRMNIWDQVEISSAGESFNSTAINQIDGEIIDFEIIEEGNRQSDVRQAETVFYCIANVKVKRGMPPDPNFTAAIEGLRSVYFEGSNLEFTITPYRDCFLKIFLFEDSQKGYRLYPNDYDTPKILLANQKVVFPQRVDFVATKDSNRPTETNWLIFVFTKDERPFYHATTSRQEIEKWMALIPNDEKYIVFTAIDIRNK